MHGRGRSNNSDDIAKWREDGQTAARYPQLVCVLKGQADFHIADYIVRCPQSHFLLFNPKIPYPNGLHPHLEKMDEGDILERRYAEVLWFNSRPGDNNRIRIWTCHSQDGKHWAKPRFDFCYIERNEVMQLYHFFIQELIDKSPSYQGIAHAAFLTFLRLFVRELKQGKFHYGGAWDSNFDGEGTSTIEMARQYMNRHLNQHLTTSNVAEAVYMSRANFVRRFHEQTGQTFNQYLTARRLEEAQRFLAQGTWKIAEISQFVGLGPAQLRNLFSSHLGTTPADFRRQSKNLSQK
jgi:AraC-like DNA-binding protein